MRLLLATDVFPPRCGGSGWSTYHLARALRARGHSVAIVRAALDPGRAAPYDYDGFQVEAGRRAGAALPVARNLVRTNCSGPWAVGRWRAAARQHGAELLHGQHVMTIPAAVRAGRALGLPVVATVRDYWPTCPISTRLRPDGICTACSGPRLTECLTGHRLVVAPVVRIFQGYVEANRRRRQAALRAADRVIAVSRYVANDLQANAGVAAEVIPNTIEVPTDTPPAPAGWPADRPYVVVFVGKRPPQGRRPAAGAGRCRRTAGDAGGAATGRSGRDRGQCTRRGLALHITDVPNAEVLRFLAHARALLFPARWPEPLSRVLLEAASVGCPVVATPTGGTSDAVADGLSGFLATDAATLTDRLRRLIDDDALRRRMGQAARWLATERFATPVVVGRMEQLYADLIERADDTRTRAAWCDARDPSLHPPGGIGAPSLAQIRLRDLGVGLTVVTSRRRVPE
jgi:glycosyltransferase involved in cell wall biosynthesis